MNWITHIADKAGATGSLVSGMGCSMCFPALASVGSALGLGFLAPWEQLFITTLLPLFAGVALVANLLSWYRHRRPYRGVLGVSGPLLVLLGLAPFLLGLGLPLGYSRGIFYVGLLLMIVSSLWDLVRPATPSCALPNARGRTGA
ncbi:MAG: organomercurial transporter MerC [Arhodomonas sp.]|nr:organomercurial transporter MerC [Arhodomonas sp.]